MYNLALIFLFMMSVMVLFLFQLKKSKRRRSVESLIRVTQVMADRNDVDAQFSLALLYSEIKDDKETTEWLIKAAKRDHAHAQFLLGLTYADGLGVQRDKQEAIKWLSEAAKQGHAEAKNNLDALLSRL